MKKRNKKTGKLAIRQKNLIALLKQVHLGGIILDAVAEVNGHVCHIEAADLSNNLVVATSASIAKQRSNKLELGLGQIDSLIKFLGTIKEPTINMALNENKLVFTRKDKKRQMNYLLSDPSMIATVLDKDDPEEDTAELFRSMQEYKVALTHEVIQDFHSYISLVKKTSSPASKNEFVKKATAVNFDGEESIEIVVGSSIEHQYTITIESEVHDIDGSGDPISLSINGEFLDKIFAVIEIDEEDPPYLWIGDSKPVLITSGDAIWALLPSAEEDE